MRIDKGAVAGQRRRHKDRYRGCRVCGLRGQHCVECKQAAEIVAIYGYAQLAVIVDGSFVDARAGDLDRAWRLEDRGANIRSARLCSTDGYPCSVTVRCQVRRVTGNYVPVIAPAACVPIGTPRTTLPAW